MDYSTAMAGSGPDTSITIHAGFPNAAVDRSGAALSLDRLLIRHPVSTYFFRIEGNQWEDQGVFDGDLAIIDRALVPDDQDLVMSWDEAGAFCLTRFTVARRSHSWGVVAAIVHQYRGRSKEQV